MKARNTDIIMQNKIFLWIAVATSILLLIPLIAMQFSDQVNWNPVDFSVMGVLLFGTGSLFALTTRRTNSNHHRIVIGVIFLLVFLYLWAELAVGIFTNLGS